MRAVGGGGVDFVLRIGGARYASTTVAPGDGIFAATIAVDVVRIGDIREIAVVHLNGFCLAERKEDGDHGDEAGQQPPVPPHEAVYAMHERLRFHAGLAAPICTA